MSNLTKHFVFRNVIEYVDLNRAHELNKKAFLTAGLMAE